MHGSYSLKKRSIQKAILATCIIVTTSLPSYALAAIASCTGTITELTQSNGSVIVRIGSYHSLSICSVDTQTNNITAQGCKAYLAGLLTAYSLGRSASIWVYNAPTTSCSSITADWFNADAEIVQLF
jgi:hypothetical protein